MKLTKETAAWLLVCVLLIALSFYTSVTRP